jgi:hypothetical protein
MTAFRKVKLAVSQGPHFLAYSSVSLRVRKPCLTPRAQVCEGALLIPQPEVKVVCGRELPRWVRESLASDIQRLDREETNYHKGVAG